MSKSERVALGNGVYVTVTYRGKARKTPVDSDPVADLRDAARRLRVAPCRDDSGMTATGRKTRS